MNNVSTVTDLSRDFMRSANSLATLVDIDAAVLELWVLLTQVEDDTWSPEERKALEQQLEQATQQQLQKIENYVGLVRKLEFLADFEDAEMTRMKARRDRKRSSAAWLKGRLLDHLKRTGQERIETGRYTVSIRQNPPAVNVLEPAMVPSEWKRTKIDVTVDKLAIRDHWRNTGELVPGVEITRGERVDIS